GRRCERERTQARMWPSPEESGWSKLPRTMAIGSSSPRPPRPRRLGAAGPASYRDAAFPALALPLRRHARAVRHVQAEREPTTGKLLRGPRAPRLSCTWCLRIVRRSRTHAALAFVASVSRVEGPFR